MASIRTTTSVQHVREAALPLRAATDFDPLIDRIGDARFVLIGEASHGTREFYHWRAELTKRLIAEHGFSFVAVEGDWPDCHRIHQAVTGAPGAPADPHSALLTFERWPTWMWANEEVCEFVRWLRAHNERQSTGGDSSDGHAVPVGFHGLDVYSLWDSLSAILRYLDDRAPEQKAAALRAYRCFEPYREDPQAYAWATQMVPQDCEDEVVGLLSGLRGETGGQARPAGALSPAFVAAQNAAVTANAERYYRTMVRGDAESWNVRDHHMADTLDRLVAAYGDGSKAVVWEHNTHVGDARATDMSAAGMVNVGQLVRERHAADGVVLVGLGSYAGSVVAADSWGATGRAMPVPAARDDSVESLLHEAVPERDSLFVVPDPADLAADSWLLEVSGHRAIGVVYDPGRDQRGNYVPSVFGRRYDAFVFCDQSAALEPIHPVSEDLREPETYPAGV